MKKIAILVLAFNRADHVVEIMKVIREYQPEKLYLECDGPRSSVKEDIEAVRDTQKALIHAVDWPCEVKTLFRDKNLGCANAVYGAVSWFFENEDYGAIIEDDILVSIDFFRMCEVLLPYYKDNKQVMNISAHNPCAELKESNEYYFTRVIRIWGWATWKRAWNLMDMNMMEWPNLNKWNLIKSFGVFQGLIRWFYYWGHTYKNIENSTSWATRWYYSCYANDGLSLCPKVNLTINIGMTEGTHYSKNSDVIYTFELGKLNFPLQIRKQVELDNRLDILEKYDFIRIRMHGIKNKIKKLCRVKI